MSEGLRDDDPGIRLLARAVAEVDPRRALLVCSGDLPGVSGDATRIVLDVRELRGARAKTVAITDVARLAGLRDMQVAAVWPRAHLGKDFTLECLARGALALGEGGRLLCAARKHKGAESLADAMVELLGNVETIERDKGYRLMASVHEGRVDGDAAGRHIGVRYEIDDPLLGDLVLHSAPGVFSRRELDAGTRALIEHVGAHADERGLVPACVIDLCAGIGPLALWAARRWSKARVWAIDSNLRAVELASENAEAAGVVDRLVVHAGDGMPEAPADGFVHGCCELALVNPPTHADRDTLGALVVGLQRWMAPGAPVFLVVSRAGVSTEALRASGATVLSHAASGYAILQASWGG